MRAIPLKLAPGSDLRESLQELAQQHQADGFVLGVVGNLSRAAFQCPGQPQPTVMEGDLEIITLNGTISPEAVHLHLSLSDGACQVWGGHLEPGTRVLKGADLLVGLLEDNVAMAEPSAPGQPESAPRVEIAVLPSCPWSRRAVRLLRTLQIPHSVNSVEDDAAADAVMNRSGMRTFPQVFIDGEVIGGYDALSEWHGSGRLGDMR
ncbi:MAG: glutaredoxin [Synechococcus sp. TMED19]|nr:MAG: glutaredoxin [Synechococcus sp. TMED19]